MKTIAQSLRPIVRRFKDAQVRRYAADAHGEVKYNCWEKPTQISEWKEEHIVIAVLATWGVTITSAMKIFGGKKEEPAPASS